MDVIPLEKKYCHRVATTLSRAFLNDPITRFLFKKEFTYKRIIWVECFCQCRRLVKKGVVCVTSDYTGAALWSPPGKKRGPSLWHTLTSWDTLLAVPTGLTMSPLAFYRICRLNADIKKRMKKEMREPHWVLEIFGVDPACHGKGYAGDLLRPMLARIDAERMPAYVVTHNEKNITFYEHFGFELISNAPSMKGAPPTCTLRRPTQG